MFGDRTEINGSPKTYTVDETGTHTIMCVSNHDTLVNHLSLHTAYLTGRQLHIWDMKRKGLTQSEIARRLNISRQAVNQLTQSIPDRVTAALQDAAGLNRIEPRLVDSVRGVLFGWSKEFQTETIITLNPKVGLRVWYQHNLGRCKICPDRKECRSSLLESANECGISLTKVERDLEPSKLSSIIFSRLLGPEAHKTTSVSARTDVIG
jgi:DNA-binding CsgD family transcriptional regulator